MMRDTSPEVDAAFTALFASRSASDRVRMACGMFEAAKRLVAADLRRQDPNITPPELRVRMFDRLYFGDFPSARRARIISMMADRP